MTSPASEAPVGAIAACLEAKRQGFTVGNRLSLPFRADFISIMIGRQRSMVGEPDLITDFSQSSRGVMVEEQSDRTDLYFSKQKSLQEEIGHWRGTLIIECCEKGADIFDFATHLRLVCMVRDDDPAVSIALQKKET